MTLDRSHWAVHKLLAVDGLRMHLLRHYRSRLLGSVVLVLVHLHRLLGELDFVRLDQQWRGCLNQKLFASVFERRKFLLCLFGQLTVVVEVVATVCNLYFADLL